MKKILIERNNIKSIKTMYNHQIGMITIYFEFKDGSVVTEFVSAKNRIPIIFTDISIAGYNRLRVV